MKSGIVAIDELTLNISYLQDNPLRTQDHQNVMYINIIISIISAKFNIF